MFAAVYDFSAADQDAWIDSECPADQTNYYYGSNPEAASSNRDTHTAAAAETTAFVTATIFDIVAAAKIIPTHREILPKFFRPSSLK
jgi:hypothetical protein